MLAQKPCPVGYVEAHFIPFTKVKEKYEIPILVAYVENLILESTPASNKIQELYNA